MYTPEQEKMFERLIKQEGARFANSNVARPQEQSIFDVGCSFLEAARRCSAPETNLDGSVGIPTSPLIACLAFACELFIKSMLLNRSKPSRGHSLEQLFNALDADDSKGIKVEYEKLTNRKSLRFKSDLQDLSFAFVDWRYIYEKGSATIWTYRLAMLAKALYLHIRSSRTAWQVGPSLHEKITAPLPEEVALTASLGGGRMIQLRLR